MPARNVRQGPEPSSIIGHDGSDTIDTEPFQSSIFGSHDTSRPLPPEVSSVFGFSVGTPRPSSARRPPGGARARGQKSGFTLGSVAGFGGGVTRLRCPSTAKRNSTDEGAASAARPSAVKPAVPRCLWTEHEGDDGSKTNGDMTTTVAPAAAATVGKASADSSAPIAAVLPARGGESLLRGPSRNGKQKALFLSSPLFDHPNAAGASIGRSFASTGNFWSMDMNLPATPATDCDKTTTTTTSRASPSLAEEGCFGGAGGGWGSAPVTPRGGLGRLARSADLSAAKRARCNRSREIIDERWLEFSGSGGCGSGSDSSMEAGSDCDMDDSCPVLEMFSPSCPCLQGDRSTGGGSIDMLRSFSNIAISGGGDMAASLSGGRVLARTQALRSRRSFAQAAALSGNPGANDGDITGHPVSRASDLLSDPHAGDGGSDDQELRPEGQEDRIRKVSRGGTVRGNGSDRAIADHVGGGGEGGGALGSGGVFFSVNVKHDGFATGGRTANSITDGIGDDMERDGTSHEEQGSSGNSGGVRGGEEAVDSAEGGDESDGVGDGCSEVVEIWRTNRGRRNVRPIRIQ